MAQCCMTLHENSLTGLVKHIVCGFALHDNLLTGLAREFVEKRTGCNRGGVCSLDRVAVACRMAAHTECRPLWTVQLINAACNHE